jgi:NitT/TauT family transport system ATP-binding protein
MEDAARFEWWQVSGKRRVFSCDAEEGGRGKVNQVRHASSEAKNGSAIEARNISYDAVLRTVLAVKEGAFQWRRPSFFACWVPSGCGKTTLLNMLAGFLVPTRGEILIDGKPVTGRGQDRGVVFQDFAQLFPWRTARRNVEFGLEVRGVPEAERRDTALHFLKLVRLEKFTDAYPHELSGGMQQRVAIARALAYNPGVLLMDEPFAALDAMTREEMQKQLTEVWQQTQKTVVYITHNVAEAVFLADQILVLAAHPGMVKSQMRLDLARPRDPLSTEFVETQRQVLRHLTH